MTKDVLTYVTEKTQQLISAPTCSAETKASAQAWLNAVGTERAADETKKFIAELEADIMPVEQLIRFADSENGRQYFGADTAANIAGHAR